MAGIGQYFKETQGELRHVAWPTRTQTIVYTVLVAAISIGVAVYLGFFDLVFTTGMRHVVDNAGTANPVQVTQETQSTESGSTAPALSLPSASSTQ